VTGRYGGDVCQWHAMRRTLGDADEAVAHNGRFRYDQWGMADPGRSHPEWMCPAGAHFN
jgi:hypothetical protein